MLAHLGSTNVGSRDETSMDSCELWCGTTVYLQHRTLLWWRGCSGPSKVFCLARARLTCEKVNSIYRYVEETSSRGRRISIADGLVPRLRNTMMWLGGLVHNFTSICGDRSVGGTLRSWYGYHLLCESTARLIYRMIPHESCSPP